MTLQLIENDRSYKSVKASENYEFEGLVAGDSWGEVISSSSSNIKVIPVILGVDENGNEKEFVYGDNYGVEVSA